MIIKEFFNPKLLILPSALLLTSCASVIDNAIENVVQTVADTLQGYRVQFHSIPAGAIIVCNGEEQGEAPFHKYYDLTPEQKRKQLLKIDNCQAKWNSGAVATLEVEIPLDQFPRFVHLATERPTDTPGYEIDEAFGEKTLALRQKQLDDANEAASRLVSLGFGIYQAAQASSDIYMPTYNAPFRSVSNHGGIRWNWVQAPTLPAQTWQPFAGFQSSISSYPLTPVYPASSRVGTIVMGRCEGKIIDSGVRTSCVGNFVNGRCLGAVLFDQ